MYLRSWWTWQWRVPGLRILGSRKGGARDLEALDLDSRRGRLLAMMAPHQVRLGFVLYTAFDLLVLLHEGEAVDSSCLQSQAAVLSLGLPRNRVFFIIFNQSNQNKRSFTYLRNMRCSRNIYNASLCRIL